MEVRALGTLRSGVSGRKLGVRKTILRVLKPLWIQNASVSRGTMGLVLAHYFRIILFI